MHTPGTSAACRALACAALLAGCKFSPADVPRDVAGNPDTPSMPGDVPVDTPPGLPTSCQDLHARDAAMPSGRYQIDPDGPGSDAPITVDCDMDTDGGGWTIVFFPPVTNFTMTPIAYMASTPRLLADAQRAMIAYRDDTKAAQANYATFPMPDAWRTDTPFDPPGTDLSTMVSVNGLAPVATTLRFGYEAFLNGVCSDGWVNAANGWGRICITGTVAPFYAGFDSTAVDTCSDSSSLYNTSDCTSAVRFSIAVR